MNTFNKGLLAVGISFSFLLTSCEEKGQKKEEISLPANLLNYEADLSDLEGNKPLAFSDQGAWFAYGFPRAAKCQGGFAGPFLMTQENGVWSSDVLSRFRITDLRTGDILPLNRFDLEQNSYNSHLEQNYEGEEIRVEQKLFFLSAHTATISTRILNKSKKTKDLFVEVKGEIRSSSLSLEGNKTSVGIRSDRSNAQGLVRFQSHLPEELVVAEDNYYCSFREISLKAGAADTIILEHTFIFPEDLAHEEFPGLTSVAGYLDRKLEERIAEKEAQLKAIQFRPGFSGPGFFDLASKCILTLQNNWRSAAGELQHAGLFPSYHYQWFHGFWAWDSWKQAAALARYDTELAKDQIRAMYDFMNADGFIADCVYRDTTIEKHNFRNTKPPLSAWSVWKVFEQDHDTIFLAEMYLQLIRQHEWWYKFRDHDEDGLCEYGSTDGSLIAAKWESGMDNGVRFDNSSILKNSEGAYSLEQESIDLNSFLFMEKNYLAMISRALMQEEDADRFRSDADSLGQRIREEFFDPETGWFYDKTIDGSSFIRVKGSEGWSALFTGIASQEQADLMIQNMMDPTQFWTSVPFQTLSADHPEFEPDGGYWRGPNWLDQSYFAIMGLEKYGYQMEADSARMRIFRNARGLMTRGSAIRENYNPITGEGLEARNFSWSAGHLLLLLTEEQPN